MNALIFEKFGSADVLEYRTNLPQPLLKSDEILLEMKSIGVNYADVYRRKGNYHLAGQPPFILGYEGSGIVAAIGKDVSHITIGDRIGFADVPYANAEYVAVPISKAIPLPEGISFDTAASMLLQGLTAQYLTEDSYSIKNNDTVLVHAAAGGVGQNLVQIAKMKGATVIGLTSSPEKAAIVSNIGADAVFLYKDEWVAQTLDFTANKGVSVVYESVGATLMSSFEATRIAGTVVFYGMAGGDPEPIDPRMLMDTSKTLTGGDLWNVLTTPTARQERANRLFNWLLEDHIKTPEPTVFALENGADAHRFLESRQSTGKLLLHP